MTEFLEESPRVNGNQEVVWKKLQERMAELEQQLKESFCQQGTKLKTKISLKK